MNKHKVLDVLISEDKHIGNLNVWINALETLNLGVSETGLDEDLENDLKSIIDRLRREMGNRITSILID